jgi:hypothetical protein
VEGNRLSLSGLIIRWGEFYLSEEDEIETRDIKLAEALNVHSHGPRMGNKATAVQAVGTLLAVNRQVRNSIQLIQIRRA